MSYVIQIWQHPQGLAYPSSLNDCAEFLASESLMRAMQNPLFIQLSQKLMSAYPDYLAALDSDMPDNWVWREPVTGQTTSAVLVININPSYRDKALSCLIPEAKTLGLSVFDPQIGQAWFANGLSLPVGLSVPVATTSEEDDEERIYADVPKNKPLRDQVFELIKPFMQQHGYKAYKRDHRFVLQFEGGEVGIKLVSVSNSWPAYGEFFIMTHGRLHSLASFKEQMIPQWVPSYQVEPKELTFCGNQQYWMPKGREFLSINQDEYQVTSYAQIPAVAEHLIQVLSNVLFPLFEQAKTIRGLDSLMNQWSEFTQETFLPLKPSMRWFDNLYIAYLVENPRLDFYIDLFNKMIDARGSWKINESERAVFALIEYMRANPLSA